MNRYQQLQRRIDAEALLRACGCPSDRLADLADLLTRSSGPLGPLVGQLLHRAPCSPRKGGRAR